MKKILYLSFSLTILMLCGIIHKVQAMQIAENPLKQTSDVHLSDWQQKTNNSVATNFSIDAYNILQINTNAYANAYLEKSFAVKANTTYTFSADVMTEAVTSTGEKDCASIVYKTSSATDGMVYNSEITGWQPLSLTFDSGNSSQVTLSLHQNWGKEAKGMTYFTNIKLVEQTAVIKDNNWNILCLIPKHIDVNVMVDNIERNVKISMSDFDVQTATKMFNRLKTSLNSMSNGQMMANIDIKVVETPLTTLSTYIDESYWASPTDIYPLVSPYLQKNRYDHVFTFVRLEADDAEYSVPCGDWQGLGAAEYMGVGYSLIRFPSDRKNWWYTSVFDALFPETGLVHEFLHTLERISNERNIDIPELHDAENLGYTARMDNSGEWYKWYSDYMNMNVTKPGTSQKFGLTPESYLLNKYQTTPVYELLKVDDSSTSNDKNIQINSLKAWTQNGLLFVCGLTPGHRWSIYSITGALIYNTTANAENANIALPAGIYIIKCETQTLKIIIGG